MVGEQILIIILAGKYGIHPTYIQEMLNDSRYNEEDILSCHRISKNRRWKKV